MGFIINFHQSIEVYMSVFLGGGKTLMSQKFLYGPKIGSPFQQMRCEGVSHGMRTYLRHKATLSGISFDNSTNASPRKRASPKIDKKGTIQGISSISLSKISSCLQVVPNGSQSLLANGY